MQEAIALLAPALMALGFYNHLHRNKLSNRRLVFAYSVFVIFINLCSYLLLFYVLGQDEIQFTNKSMILYLIFSSIFAFIWPFVVNLVENTIAIEVKKNDPKK